MIPSKQIDESRRFMWNKTFEINIVILFHFFNFGGERSARNFRSTIPKEKHIIYCGAFFVLSLFLFKLNGSSRECRQNTHIVNWMCVLSINVHFHSHRLTKCRCYGCVMFLYADSYTPPKQNVARKKKKRKMKKKIKSEQHGKNCVWFVHTTHGNTHMQYAENCCCCCCRSRRRRRRRHRWFFSLLLRLLPLLVVLTFRLFRRLLNFFSCRKAVRYPLTHRDTSAAYFSFRLYGRVLLPLLLGACACVCVRFFFVCFITHLAYYKTQDLYAHAQSYDTTQKHKPNRIKTWKTKRWRWRWWSWWWRQSETETERERPTRECVSNAENLVKCVRNICQQCMHGLLVYWRRCNFSPPRFHSNNRRVKKEKNTQNKYG